MSTIPPARRLSQRRVARAATAAFTLAAIVAAAAWWQHRRSASLCSTRTTCARGCDGGVGVSCTRLAELLENGIGGEADWKEAARRQRLACEGGLVDACAKLARLTRLGQGVPRNLARAQEMTASSCERGSPEACEALSEDNRFGVGMPTEVTRADTLAARALGLHRQRCDRDDADSCIALSDRLDAGKGTPKDEKQAAVVLKRGRELQKIACDKGDLLACRAWRPELAKLDQARRSTEFQRACDLDDGNSCYFLVQPALSVRRASPEATVAMTKRACMLGVSAACEDLGTWFEKGEGVPPDPSAAIAFFRNAAGIRTRQCDAGDAFACLALSKQVNAGDGVPKDAAEAARLAALGLAIYGDDCEAGDALACYSAGDILSDVLSEGSNDLARAATFYEVACRRDARFACSPLARLYQEGQGVPRDDEKAAALLRRACDAGSAGSCFKVGDTPRGILLTEESCDRGYSLSCDNLSVRYEKGDGVPVDHVRADALNARACLLGGGHDCQK